MTAYRDWGIERMREISTSDFHIEPVPVEARDQFRAMAESYWRDLMPDAAVCKSRESRDYFFQETFTWAGGNRHPHWALIEKQPIGFVSFEIEDETAYVRDFYIAAEYRRKRVWIKNGGLDV